MKNNKANSPQLPENEVITEKHKFYTQPWVIAVAAVLVVVLIVGILMGVSMNAQGITLGQLITDADVRDRYFSQLFGYELAPVDFLNDDLSKYVDLSDNAYRGYDIKVSISKPGALELDNKILNLLASKRDVQNVNREYKLNVPITAGDAAYIYYTGYMLGENGERIDIPSTSNFDMSVDELKASGGIKIGGSTMIPGFELALVGKVPNEYNYDFTKKIGGKLPSEVPENCVIYATASYVMEDGLLYEDEPIRIDFRSGNAEDKWGIGVYDYLCEKNIGMANTDSPITLACADGNRITYTRMTVNYFTQCESDALVIETKFPTDYKPNPDLAGKTVFFDIYFYGVVVYDTPEFNEAFILDTLGVKAEDIADYEGADTVEKYKSYLMAELNAEYDKKVKEAAEEKMWEYLEKNVKVNSLPQREVVRIYENYYYEMFNEYRRANADGAGYESLDEYARESLGLDIGADWTEYLLDMTESDVRRKLIFYSIIRREGLVPTEAEFAEVYRRELELDFEYYYGKTADDYDTYEAFEEALYAYEDEMLEAVGLSYYHDAVYSAYASEKILALANIVNTEG